MTAVFILFEKPDDTVNVAMRQTARNAATIAVTIQIVLLVFFSELAFDGFDAAAMTSLALLVLDLLPFPISVLTFRD